MTGEQIIQTRSQLATTRAALDSHWRELAELYMPFRSVDAKGSPDIIAAADIHDSTPRRCALILANGLASLLSAREDTWFAFTPPRALRRDEEAIRFYRNATETIRELLEESNLYPELQECYIEAPVFGTTAIFIGDMGENSPSFFFLNQPIGTYFITEDSKKRVNSIYRDLHLTADQAAEEFGRDALPPSLAGKLTLPEAKTETHDFVHCVYRRPAHEEAGADAPEADRKPWVSLTVHTESKQVVHSGGFDEFPFAVHRYRRYGRCVWGFGPGTTCIGDPRQLQFISQLVDAGTEKAVFPPVQAPASLEGEVGLGALEITYLDSTDPNAAAMLREWAPAGRIDHAVALVQDKRQQLREGFHVDLFTLFSQRAHDRAPLTATEAGLISGEKLAQFSPVHGRIVGELLSPLLLRCFGMALRAGALGAPPASVIAAIGKGAAIQSPIVTYHNRVVLAMMARQNLLLRDYMELVGPILGADPTGADTYNFPAIYRDTARNAGLPEDWIRPKKEVEQMAAARAQAQQQQMELEGARVAAAAAADLGKAPPPLLRDLSRAANFSVPQ